MTGDTLIPLHAKIVAPFVMAFYAFMQATSDRGWNLAGGFALAGFTIFVNYLVSKAAASRAAAQEIGIYKTKVDEAQRDITRLENQYSQIIQQLGDVQGQLRTITRRHS